MYESERDNIEGMYWEARDQIRQRLLGAIEERRRKLREEKEGGDVVTGELRPLYRELTTETLLETTSRPRNQRRTFRSRVEPRSSSRSATPNHHNLQSGAESGSASPKDGSKSNDLLLHNMLAPALAVINTDDVLYTDSSSLIVKALPNGFNVQSGKRGPRGKAAEMEKEGPAPGTSAALAIASGQAPAPTSNGKRGAGAQSGWVLGKALNDMKKMEEATLLERDSDWARIQGSQGRGRRGRGE